MPTSSSSRAESRAVNAAGLVQGIALVSVPAASSILTNPQDYGLTSSQYGALFLPQVVAAVAASLLGPGLSQRISAKRVLLIGLGCDAAAMLLVLVTAPIAGQPGAYPLLLIATALLGTGFGLTVPALNTFAAQLHPRDTDRAVLVLNALLGLGTALAPVFVAVFVGLGFWWGLPLLASVLLVAVLAFCARLPLTAQVDSARLFGAGVHLPPRFWLFAGFALLYGICETMNGNWSQLDMTSQLGASAEQASLALAAFWAMVTIGRIGFAGTQRWLPPSTLYHALPVVLVISFLLLGTGAVASPEAGIAAFGLAGLGCSALLPLTISFGQEQLATIAGAAAGGVIASYQVGYGVAAFGVGSLLSGTASLTALFGWTAVAASGMFVLSFVITGHRTTQAMARA